MSSIYELREPLLKELEGYRIFNARQRDLILNSILKKRISDPQKKKLFYKEVSQLYDEAAIYLTSKYPLVLQRTHSEVKALKYIHDYTKLVFHQSYWIGKYNCDLFTPSVAGYIEVDGLRGRGLAIEIDGGIHFDELKMRKDESKYSFLHGIGIQILSINNKDLSTGKAIEIFKKLKYLPKLDSRARERLKQRIYIETILSCKNPKYSEELLRIAAKYSGVTNE